MMLDSLLQPHTLPDTFTAARVNGIRRIEPGETFTLADIEGPGCVRHLFVTMPPKHLRKLVLRFYWDGEESPSVECPVSDFFGIGHDEITADLRSALFYIAPKYGYNCYIPMPFAKRCRITIANEGDEANPAVYLMLTMHRYADAAVPPWRFHAVWRRVMPAYRRGAPLTLLEAKGDGRLLGVIYHICKRDSDDRWSHGGGDQMFIDGETANPVYVYGVGGEDFAHHAWGLYPALGPYSGAHSIHPVPGVKRPEGPNPFEGHGWEQHDWGRYSMFRYFIPDPVTFRHSIRLTFGTCANEISGTTYWYQSEPHADFATLPPKDKRGFGVRLSEEECTRPLSLGSDVPAAVLGPMRADGQVWTPESGADLVATYETDVKQPFGDVVRPPYRIGWRRSIVRGGFIDLAAIHRPKCAIRSRALWNYRHLPLGVISYQLIRLRAAAAGKVTLRVGYEDRLLVWVNGAKVGELVRPEPELWDTDDVALDLQEGVNDIVIGATQDRLARWSAWGLYVKFLDAQEPAFDDFADLAPTAERFREPWPLEDSIPCDNPRDPLDLM